MKMKTTVVSAVVMAMLLGMTSCGKKDESTEKTTEALKQLQTSTQQAENASTPKTPGVAVPSKTLVGFLPKPAGYTMEGEAQVMDMEMQGAKYASASATYKNGDKGVKVEILDYNYIAGLSAAYSTLLSMNMETNDEIIKSEKIGGFPGWLNWHKKNNEGTVGVVVNDRIYVITEAESGTTIDELRSIANSIDYSSIASAAASAK